MVLQVHNNVGFLVTCAMNLILLLPPATATNPRVDNFVIILYVGIISGPVVS